jgi:very-short-patch-repair endonuclease
LRRNETQVEAKLWEVLRARRLGGHRFVRQFPIGPYSADFACREAALVVEVDGSQHAESPRDMVRDNFLSQQGYSVLRFWNTDVLLHPFSVAETILAALALHPSPGDRFTAATLSPEGRGQKGASAATTRQRSLRLSGDIARLRKLP